MQLDPESGIIHPDEYISRDGYDWVSDSIVFHPKGTDAEIPVEDGAMLEGTHDVDFGVMADDLPQARREWAKSQAREMDDILPVISEKAVSRPRL